MIILCSKNEDHFAAWGACLIEAHLRKQDFSTLLGGAPATVVARASTLLGGAHVV